MMPCERDDDCPAGKFCYISNKCVPCIDCAPYNRQKSHKMCIQKPADCGPCIEGYKSVATFSISGSHDYCSKIETPSQNALFDPVLWVSIIVVVILFLIFLIYKFVPYPVCSKKIVGCLRQISVQPKVNTEIEKGMKGRTDNERESEGEESSQGPKGGSVVTREEESGFLPQISVKPKKNKPIEKGMKGRTDNEREIEDCDSSVTPFLEQERDRNCPERLNREQFVQAYPFSYGSQILDYVTPIQNHGEIHEPSAPPPYTLLNVGESTRSSPGTDDARSSHRDDIGEPQEQDLQIPETRNTNNPDRNAECQNTSNGESSNRGRNTTDMPFEEEDLQTPETRNTNNPDRNAESQNTSNGESFHRGRNTTDMPFEEDEERGSEARQFGFQESTGSNATNVLTQHYHLANYTTHIKNNVTFQRF